MEYSSPGLGLESESFANFVTRLRLETWWLETRLGLEGLVTWLQHCNQYRRNKRLECGKLGHSTLLRVINCFSTTSTMYYKENKVVTCIVFHFQSLIASEWTYTSTSAYCLSTWPDNWYVDWSCPPDQSKQWVGSVKTGVFNEVVWHYFQALILMWWSLSVFDSITTVLGQSEATTC